MSGIVLVWSHGADDQKVLKDGAPALSTSNTPLPGQNILFAPQFVMLRLPE
jgi:hypothetical protein